MSERVKVDIDRVEVTAIQDQRGMTIFLAWAPECAAPAGVLVVSFGANSSDDGVSAHIWWSYVVPWARRSGIRTKMHEYIVKWYDRPIVFRTGRGSDEGGEDWLISAGFVYDEERSDWYLAFEPEDGGAS